MAGARPLLGFAGIVLLAGGIVLQFLVILSGAVNSNPVNLVYFLQASTDGVSGRANLPNPVRWTYFALCGEENSRNANCYPVKAALPFDPPRNFGTDAGLSDAFNGNKFFLLSRFMFAFYLIALFFAVISFLLSVFALCARLGSYLTGFTVFLALFFQTLTAALMTAWVVQGRNAFRANNQPARIGVYGMAFTWAAMAAFFLSAIFFCIGGRVGKEQSTTKSSYFGRKRSTRSRGSFRDSESGRRVNDEYD